MAYSNSVRTGPRLRLLSAIVATSFAIRTLALWPLLFAISPSRIRTLRLTAVFQTSLVTKYLRYISRILSTQSLVYEAPWIMHLQRQNSVMNSRRLIRSPRSLPQRSNFHSAHAGVFDGALYQSGGLSFLHKLAYVSEPAGLVLSNR